MSAAMKLTLAVRDPDGQAVALVKGSEVPEWAKELVHPDDLEAGSDTPSEPYKGVKVADLKAEVEMRNADREDDDKVVPAEPGNRPEIVAALVADDEKLAAAGDGADNN